MGFNVEQTCLYFAQTAAALDTGLFEKRVTLSQEDDPLWPNFLGVEEWVDNFKINLFEKTINKTKQEIGGIWDFVGCSNVLSPDLKPKPGTGTLIEEFTTLPEE